MNNKILITTASVSAVAVSGYAFYRWLFKEPGHPANWGPTQAIEHLKEHGHLPDTLRRSVRRQVASAENTLTEVPLLVCSGMDTIRENLPDDFFAGKFPAVTHMLPFRHMDFGVKEPAEAKTSEPEAVTEIMNIVVVNDSTEDAETADADNNDSEYDRIPEGAKVCHIVMRESDVKDGAIKAFSPAYKTLIKKAVKAAEKDEDYRLYNTGSTYGLGSRGSSMLMVGPEAYVHVYDLKTLKKLMAKLTADADRA